MLLLSLRRNETGREQTTEKVGGPMADLASLGKKQQAWKETWPVRSLRAVVDALKLPGDVATGEFNTPPSVPGQWSEEDEARARFHESEMLNRAFDFAGMVIGTNFATTAARRAARKAAESGAESMSQSAHRQLYDPPVKPPRPFAADYPMTPSVGPNGKLAVDMEGRPLTAKYVVGRRRVGEMDVGLTPAEVEDVATTLMGGPPLELAADEIGRRGILGRYDKQNGRRYISILKTADPELKPLILGHETGHLIEDMAGVVKGPNPGNTLGAIPQNGIWSGLRKVYHTLSTGEEGVPAAFGPEMRGYAGKKIERELMAEAIRAYLFAPNYFKTIAPAVAARIRSFVNSNPELAGVIQFNSFLGGALLGKTLEDGGVAEATSGLLPDELSARHDMESGDKPAENEAPRQSRR